MDYLIYIFVSISKPAFLKVHLENKGLSFSNDRFCLLFMHFLMYSRIPHVKYFSQFSGGFISQARKTFFNISQALSGESSTCLSIFSFDLVILSLFFKKFIYPKIYISIHISMYYLYSESLRLFTITPSMIAIAHPITATYVPI